MRNNFPAKLFMKKNLAVLLFGFAIVVNSFSAPTSAEQLRSELETAVRAKDTNTILALFNWTGVQTGTSPDMKKMMTSIAAMLVYDDIASVKLSPVPAGFQPTNEMNGVRYFPNVPIVGIIDVESVKKGNATHLPYGETSGKFYISGTAQETFDTSANKSIGISLMVTGFFPEKSPGILNCSYVYVAGGKEKTDGFQCTNSWTHSFFGDYIKSCKLTKVSGIGSYELEIYEGTNSIFDSDMVETNNSISYERKKP
jgi:hypothetical protein